MGTVEEEEESMGTPDSTSSAPPPQQPQQQPPPPPPQQSWQSQPQQPAPPPPGSGQSPSTSGGMPSWTSNITSQGTIVGPGGTALADLPNRIIAAVIDFIILSIVAYIVGMIIHPILGERFGFGGIFTDVVVPSLLSSLVVVLIMAAVSAGYFIYMWLKMDGATVGMRLLKLQVRDSASGGVISQDQAIKRWAFLAGPWALSWFYGWGIGFIISILILVYYIYLVISAAQSPTRQGLHDQQARTVVAKVR